MEGAQNLAFFILIAQAIASIVLVFSSVLDAHTFGKYGGNIHIAIPGLRKIIRLFSNTPKNYMMGLYFMSLIFVVLSYAGIIYSSYPNSTISPKQLNLI